MQAKRGISRAILLITLLLPACAVAQNDPLQTLRPEHPRLLALDDSIERIRRLERTDPLVKRTVDQLIRRGEQMLKEPTARYRLIGPRLLDQSRFALDVISTTAGLYRITGDERFAQRARREMLAVCAFPDWHPPHFLDTAEMTNACAIGYDWIYSYLSPDDRAIIRRSIVEKGLRAGIEGYSKGAFWTKAPMNWGQVCAGGLTMGALAVADEEPDVARRMLRLTLHSIHFPMSAFAPDGGWIEGPGYWNYATMYNAIMVSALQTALGSDEGLLAEPGYSQTPQFQMYATGPGNEYFNFADCGQASEAAPQMFWMAHVFDQPIDAAWERAHFAGRLGIFDLIWFDDRGDWPGQQPLPLDRLFRGINVAFFRGDWTNPNAWYVGFKGGDNAANHAHLDLGTFVLDALGQRWAMELGSDDYNLPGYFGAQRWNYYRLRTEGQNTLTIDDENQQVHAKAPVIRFSSHDDWSSAIADLTGAYPQARRAWRGMAMIGRRRVLLEDELDLRESSKVTWNLHTSAQVKIVDDGAILTRGGVSLRVRLLSPAGARFQAIACNPPPPQKQNVGVTNLIIRLPDFARGRIVVLFSGVEDGQIPRVRALDEWP
ncbi:MAG TPA: heparinase II/III family protein [Tepidisphaeraceae bacterium]|nr:heparinase II/III family protein [Tepidisphaeraceae bacterium]